MWVILTLGQQQGSNTSGDLGLQSSTEAGAGLIDVTLLGHLHHVWVHCRSVRCSDTGMSALPVNIPPDTVKLRLEKTLISRVPRAAFYNLSELWFLWLTYNSITSVHPSSFVNLKALRELRLDGNLLTTFPWEGLRDMPRLQTLGLNNNRLSSLPAHAALFLPNITYLDLSSNRWDEQVTL